MASDAINATLPKPLYGIKFAKAGFDTRTANDYELLFNSGWPSIAIAYSTSVNSGGGSSASIANPLKFPAFAMAWIVQNGVVRQRLFPSVSPDWFFFINIPVGDVTIYLQAYNLDISKQASYNYIPVPPAQIGVYNPNYGAKFAKPGKEMTSQNLNDFIFHTRAMSPAILSINTTFDKIPLVGGAQTITTVNPSNYIPWAFGYAQDVSNPGVWAYAEPYAQATPRLFVNLKPNSFTVAGATNSPRASLITLRDPLFVANTVEVVY